MPWPQSTDYNLAIQNPHLCFEDAELRACTAASNDPVLGLPTPRAGNFADVYQMVHPSGRSWAVKCFTREVDDLHDRYAAISDYLARNRRSFIIEFRYLDQGILVDGTWYPVLKMRWVEGKTLNEFVRENADKSVLMDRLGQMWLKLERDLREVGLGHGDLQHGNVLLVPNPQKASLHLRLIDYDGMYVPALADRPSREAGFPGFQHPRRTQQLYGPEVDRFANLVIYTALRALRTGGGKLWSTFGTPENLLFAHKDFTEPAQSDLLRTLFASPDVALRHLVGHLVLAAVGAVHAVPLLSAVAPGGAVRRLDLAQYEYLRQIVGPMLVPPRKSKVETRTPAPRLDDLLRNSPRLEPASVPQARRAETGGLPDWMRPEAMPEDDTIVRALPDEEEVETLAVPPLVLVPLDPVERPIPAVPRLTPVLVETEAAVPVRRKPVAEPVPVLEAVPEPQPQAQPQPQPARQKAAPLPTALPADEEPARSVLGFVLAAVLVVCCAAVGGALVYVLRSDPVPQPPPPPDHATLRLPKEVTLDGGQTQVIEVRFQPHRDRSPFRVQLVDLPPTLTLVGATDPEPAGDGLQKVTFTVRVQLSGLPTTTVPVPVQLFQGERLVDTQTLRVVVRRPQFPVLVLPPTQVRIAAGTSERLPVRIDRHDRAERLTVELSGTLPAGVELEAADIGPGATEGTITVKATKVPATTAPTTSTASLRLLFHPGIPGVPRFEVDQARVEVILDLPRLQAQFLSAPARVRLEVGGTAPLRVSVNRKVLGGVLRGVPLTLELLGLPPGVAADPITIPASAEMGDFQLRARETATVARQPLRILAYQGTSLRGELPTELSVERTPR